MDEKRTDSIQVLCSRFCDPIVETQIFGTKQLSITYHILYVNKKTTPIYGMTSVCERHQDEKYSAYEKRAAAVPNSLNRA